VSIRAALGDLVRVSRPISWVNTALPFVAVAFDATRELTPLLLLGAWAFAVPYNLLLYGVNDVFDYASDARNPRKGSAEGGLVPPERARRTLIAIAALNVPWFGLLAWFGGPIGALALVATLVVAIVYSAPPLRTKERPLLDSLTSALHFALPALCGSLVVGGTLGALPWGLLAAFVAWGIGSHALGAIQDIESDRGAGIGSIATAAGARRTALLVLGAYAAVVVAVATHGGLGVVAAVVLSLYLLLPLAVLARPAEPAAARRAWRGFLGLNYLAGFVVTQLLLWHWGLTATDPWNLAIGASAGAAGIALANALLTRLGSRRRRGRGAGVRPSITVVVPCRNEAARLPATLAALIVAAQAVDAEVLVVDDGSSDGSPAAAAIALAALGERGRVLRAPAKPAGWAGKGWACQIGAEAARTDLLLFLDADTVLEPRALEVLIDELTARDADLVSGVTRYSMPTVTERIAVPGFPMLLFGFVPVWLAGTRLGRRIGFSFAYGPILLVRRAAYLRSGGHGATPGSAREDLDLAANVVRSGGRVAVVHAADLAWTRHYPTARDAVAAWRRVLLPYAGRSLALGLAAIAGQLLAFGVPLMLLPVALVVGAPAGVVAAACLPLGLLISFRLVLSATQRLPVSTVALHPLTLALTVAAQVLAIADWVAGRPLAWRGRELPSEPHPAKPPTPVGETAR